MADMICVDNMEKRVAQPEAAGITDIAVHTGVDMQAAGRTPPDDLKQIKALQSSLLFRLPAGLMDPQWISTWKPGQIS